MRTPFFVRDGVVHVTSDRVQYLDHVRRVASEIESGADAEDVRGYVEAWRQWTQVYDVETGEIRGMTADEDATIDAIWNEYVDDIVEAYLLRFSKEA